MKISEERQEAVYTAKAASARIGMSSILGEKEKIDLIASCFYAVLNDKCYDGFMESDYGAWYKWSTDNLIDRVIYENDDVYNYLLDIYYEETGEEDDLYFESSDYI